MQDILQEYTYFSENSFLKTDKRKKRTGFHSKVKLGALSSLPTPAGQPPGVVRFMFLSYGHPASGSGPFQEFQAFQAPTVRFRTVCTGRSHSPCILFWWDSFHVFPHGFCPGYSNPQNLRDARSCEWNIGCCHFLSCSSF